MRGEPAPGLGCRHLLVPVSVERGVRLETLRSAPAAQALEWPGAPPAVCEGRADAAIPLGLRECRVVLVRGDVSCCGRSGHLGGHF